VERRDLERGSRRTFLGEDVEARLEVPFAFKVLVVEISTVMR
jgi:hypothetical protein